MAPFPALTKYLLLPGADIAGTVFTKAFSGAVREKKHLTYCKGSKQKTMCAGVVFTI